MNLQNSSAASKRFPEVLLLGWWIDKFFFPKTILWYPRIPGSISSIPENLFHSSRATWSAKETSNYLLDQRHRFNYLKHPKESPILFSCLRALQKWQNKRKVQNHSTNAWKSTSKTSKIGKKKTGPFLKITSSWFHFIKKINRAWPPRSGQQKKSNQSVAVKPAQPPWSSGKKFKKKKKKKCPLCPVWSDRFVRFDSNRSTVQPMKIEIRTPHCYWISSSSIVLHFVSMRRFCWKGRFFAVCFFAVGTLGLWSKKSNCVLQTHK